MKTFFSLNKGGKYTDGLRNLSLLYDFTNFSEAVTKLLLFTYLPKIKELFLFNTLKLPSEINCQDSSSVFYYSRRKKQFPFRLFYETEININLV